MAMTTHHMGRIVTGEQYAEFHQTAPVLSDRQRDALMERMGITKEQDEERHRTHLTLAQQRAEGVKQVNATALGAECLTWCVKQGYLQQQGKTYYATKDDISELREGFGILA